jgi:hypothetical protein
MSSVSVPYKGRRYSLEEELILSWFAALNTVVEAEYST